MKKKIDRRRLLQTSGIALGLPWLEALSGPAWAQTTGSGAAKRFIVYYNELGTIPSEWAGGSGGDFTLKKILQPLSAHKEKMTVFKGLNQNGKNGAHAGRDISALTGHELLGNKDTSNNAGGPSIDQLIAEKIGGSTRRKSIYMDMSFATKIISHKARNAPVAPMRNPHQAFDQYLGSVTPSAGGGGATQEQLSRKKLLDHVLERHKYWRDRVGAEDKRRLEQHIQGVDELVRQLELTTAPPSQECTIPDYDKYPGLPTTKTAAVKERNQSADQRTESLLKSYIDITAHSVACGVTNVALLSAGALHNHGKDSHNANINNRSANSGAYDRVLEASVKSAGMLNTLVNKLSSMPEGGGSVMDNTMILWLYQLSDGNNHKSADARQVLIGNAGGAFNMGRLHAYNPSQNRPHNELLTSLLNVYGVNNQKFGMAQWQGAGRLPGFDISS